MNDNSFAAEQMRRVTLAQCAMLSAYAEIQGMLVANKEREQRGESPAYGEAAFDEVMTRNGAHWNQIVTVLNE